MPLIKVRFITVCQQLLALGLVLAALTPAASVVSLDVVHEAPGSAPPAGALAAYARAGQQAAVLPAAPVDPIVTEHALTAPPGGKSGAPVRLLARAKTVPGGGTTVVSRPAPVTGYGAVGVTWQHGHEVDDDTIAFRVRTMRDGAWTEWADLQYHDEHAPDPDSDEGRHARPGTEPLVVGDVDAVQVSATADGAAPPDLRLAVVDPGSPARTVTQRPAIHTDALAGDDQTVDADAAAAEDDAQPGKEPAAALRAATYTPQPEIFSRAQWGADERMRDRSSLSYFEVHAGFVHHTVNANDYTRAEVPGILRSIYAYHTQSRGWSDIGYNFLVDRFGRIWEGRYGGVDRPVVGAHTLNYNEYSFAMSAIGNFDTARPSAAMVQAYGALFAWKLSLHGVAAGSTQQRVGARSFPAVNGHRDAASTACPGKHLYARVGRIRELAAAAQRGWEGRELESDLAGSPHPDLVVRRASDGQAFVLPTGGMTRLVAPRTLSSGWPAGDTAVVAGDLTGDGLGDLLVQAADGSAAVRAGDGAGGFGEPVKPTRAFEGHDLVTAVGDLDGDGRADLVARRTEDGRLDAYLGRAGGALHRTPLGTGWSAYDLVVGAGDLTGDGRPDLLARDGDRMWLHAAAGGARLADPVRVPGSWRRYDVVQAFGDHDGDGHPDLFVRRASSGLGFVLPGEGDGGFGAPWGPLRRAKALTALTAGQVAGSGAVDLVGRRGERLVLLENAGTRELGRPIPTGLDLSRVDLLLNVGDWDRDGHGDLVTRGAENGRLHLRLGDGRGGFGKAREIARGFGSVGLLAAVGDMTGDGWPDLMGQPRGESMRLYPGRGLDGLAPGYAAHSRIDAGRQVGVGRWDADGSPDTLFRKGDRIAVYAGNGPGGLTSPRSVSGDLEPYDWVVGVSDADGDGHADLVVRAAATGRLFLLPGSPDGFAPRRFLGEGMEVYDLAG